MKITGWVDMITRKKKGGEDLEGREEERAREHGVGGVEVRKVPGLTWHGTSCLLISSLCHPIFFLSHHHIFSNHALASFGDIWHRKSFPQDGVVG